MAVDYFYIKCGDGSGYDLPVKGRLSDVDFSDTLTLQGAAPPTYQDGYLVPSGNNYGDLQDISQLSTISDPTTSKAFLTIFTLYVEPGRSSDGADPLIAENGILQYNAINTGNTLGGYGSHVYNATNITYRGVHLDTSGVRNSANYPIVGLRTLNEITGRPVTCAFLMNTDDAWESFVNVQDFFDNNQAMDASGTNPATLTNEFSFLSGQSSAGGFRSFFNGGGVGMRIKDFWHIALDTVNMQQVGEFIKDHGIAGEPAAKVTRL